MIQVSEPLNGYLALRALVREVYVKRFSNSAAARIEAALRDAEREALGRALRSRPRARIR